MMLERIRKDGDTRLEVPFTWKADPGEPAPALKAGKLTLELFPLVLDVSRSLVNLEDFPTKETTSEEAAQIEAQLDALKDQDHWKALLSLIKAFFPVLATIETDPPTLHEITPEQRAAFWQALSGAAGRYFSGLRAQYAPAGTEAQATPPQPSSTRARTFATKDPTPADDKRPLPVTGSLVGGQLWFSFGPRDRQLLETNLPTILGRDFTVPQQRVFKAMQKHISRSNVTLFHFRNGFPDLARLCEIEPSGKEYQELVTAFMELAEKPQRLYWVFKQHVLDFHGTFWQVTRGFEHLSPSEKASIRDHALTGAPLDFKVTQLAREIVGQAAAILLPGPLYYREHPDTEKQIRAIHAGKKRSPFLDPFLRWIDGQYFTVREKAAGKDAWTIGPLSLRACCESWGMENLFKQRRPTRAFSTARKLAEIAVRMNHLKSFDFHKPQAVFLILDVNTLEAPYEKAARMRAPTVTMPPALPEPATAQKPKKSARPLSEEEQEDARALFDMCANILRTLPAEFQAQGFTVTKPELSDDHVRQFLRTYIRPHIAHPYGYEPQITEGYLLGKEDKGGLRYFCKQIPARAKKAADEDRRRTPTKSIGSLSRYLLAPQRKDKAHRNLIEKEMIALADLIPKWQHDYRAKNLDNQGPEKADQHAAMTRRVKALALWLGLDWPSPR